MLPPSMLPLLVAGAFAGVASAGCNADNCARAVSATRFGAATLASRLGDCSSFFEVTVTPPTSTVWVTQNTAVTVTSEILLQKRVGTTDPAVDNPSAKTVPAYASPCSGTSRYSSACSCWGVTTSTSTAPTPLVTSTLTATSTATLDVYDSPPLPSSPVQFPEFEDWTSTYTYEEYTLPVFTATGDPPISINYPTPSTTCLLDATPTGDTFYLLYPGAGYMFEKDGALGPVDPPTDEASADALLASWNPPTFEFQVAEGAPAGLFDLVVHDDTSQDLYVALDVSSGNINLVPSSTNGALQDGYSTTVFGVSCLGSLVVEYDSSSYLWMATNSSTIAVPGSPPTNNTSPLNTMLLLPTRIQTPVGQTQRRHRMSKRDHSQDGIAPRCPGFPYGSVMAVSNGVQPGAPNGCGPDGEWYTALIPNLDFGGCCNNHDTCYDRCSDWFEDCNDVFHSCMSNKCTSTYDHWYNSWLQPGCLAAADLYYWAVSGGTAQKHFQDGSKEECSCVCSDSNTAVCSQGGTCIRVRGLGADDSNNCGGCGWNCGSHAHCQDGRCVCNAPTADQCGNTCLDFLTHPRNCGRCGNVCSSGYCYQGQCFTPPAVPDRCYPVDAVQNGDFSQGGANWAWYSTRGGLDIELVNDLVTSALGIDNAPANSIALLPSLKPALASDMVLTQTIHICPGTQYQLDFQAFGRGLPLLDISVGGHTIVSGASMANPQYPSSFYGMGPYTLPIFNVGDPGTSPAANFYLTTELVITISPGVISEAFLSDFSVHL